MHNLKKRLEALENGLDALGRMLVAACQRPRIWKEIKKVVSGGISNGPRHPRVLAYLKLSVTCEDYVLACRVADDAGLIPPVEYRPEWPFELRVKRWRYWDSFTIAPLRDGLLADYETYRRVPD